MQAAPFQTESDTLNAMRHRSGLRLAGDRPAFYIKPADRFELPGITKWLKQPFALGYNQYNGRTGRLGAAGTGRVYWKGSRRTAGSVPAAGNASPDMRFPAYTPFPLPLRPDKRHNPPGEP
ncbi:MAG: hypothetical protein LBO04_00095 [Spirochaetaceae bacterium]|jgi:hypothetical protein|nr:hypothetical protein [Spirochaetaceae bacterium]